MADKTHIEWTEATWNPVTGCSKVSAGCKHCYAERDWARLSANPKTRYYGRAFTDVQCHSDVLELPLRWKRPRRIFANSMSDLFHESVSDAFIDQVFAVMAVCSRHTFQVLTKRAARMRAYVDGFQRRQETTGINVSDGVIAYLGGRTNMPELRWPLNNVWLGVSVEDQATAEERIPILLQTPAAVRWISAEPLLGPVQFRWDRWLPVSGPEQIEREQLRTIDWVVVGGESGRKARLMLPAWARSLRDQCAAVGVPMLFKQWGEFAPAAGGLWGTPENRMDLVGKKAAGRLLDGKLHDDYPAEVPF